FAGGTAVAEKLPAGVVFQDVAGKRPLQAAVVPFDEVGIHFRDRAKPGQLAGPGGALQMAGEYTHKGEIPQPLAQLPRGLYSVFIQRQIGSTRVLVGVGPIRVSMSREKEPRQGR